MTKGTHNTTRLKRTRPRGVKTVIATEYQPFCSIVEEDEENTAGPKHLSFASFGKVSVKADGTGAEWSGEETHSSIFIDDKENRPAADSFEAKLKDLNAQFSDDSDFSLVIEREDGVRMKEDSRGELVVHPVQNEQPAIPDIPEDTANNSASSIASPAQFRAPAPFRDRLRESLAFPDRTAVAARQIREIHALRTQQRPSAASSSQPPAFSIMDLVAQRGAQLPEQTPNRLLRKSLIKATARASLTPLREDRNFSGQTEDSQPLVQPSPIISKAAQGRLTFGCLNESSFAPPLASTPIVERTGIQPRFSTASTTPVTVEPKRRRTNSPETLHESAASDDQTMDEGDDEAQNTVASSIAAEDPAETEEAAEVDEQLAACLENSMDIGAGGDAPHVDDVQPSGSDSTLGSIAEADEEEPEAEASQQDATRGETMAENQQTLQAHEPSTMVDATLGIQQEAIGRTFASDITMGQNNYSAMTSMQTLPVVDPSLRGNVTGLRMTFNQTQMSATRRNVTQMQMEDSIMNDRPFFLDKFEGDMDDPLQKLLHIIDQKEVVGWREGLPKDVFKKLKKLGEGVYGEVFATTWNGVPTAVKVIPFQNGAEDGEVKVNGEYLKSTEEILPEVLITRELSALAESRSGYQTSNFIELLQARVVRGLYPEELLDAWDEYDGRKGSENDRPDEYATENRHFIVIALAMGGVDIENYKVKNEKEMLSILLQLIFAMMAAERELSFEHRDLHIGNVLVKECSQEFIQFRMNGLPLNIRSHGVHVNIIDFTNSRLSKAGVNIYLDLEADEELFEGQGHYQFDIYRMMRENNRGDWASFEPKSNVFWLHYMARELLERNAKKRILVKRKKELLAIFDTLLACDELSAFVYDDAMAEICEEFLQEGGDASA